MKNCAIFFGAFMFAVSHLSAHQFQYFCIKNGDVVTFSEKDSSGQATFSYQDSKGEGFYLAGEQFVMKKNEGNLQVFGSLTNQPNFSAFSAAFPLIESNGSVKAHIKFTNPAGMPLGGGIYECNVERIALSEAPYHCPWVKDVKKDGHFYANTDYNGHPFRWWDLTRSFFEDEEVGAFIEAQVWDCESGSCNVRCLYKKTNSDYDISLEEIFYLSKVIRASGSNWNGYTCTAQNPEECVFYVAKRWDW